MACLDHLQQEIREVQKNEQRHETMTYLHDSVLQILDFRVDVCVYLYQPSNNDDDADNVHRTGRPPQTLPSLSTV
jgi:hypothetical protein